MSTKLPIHTIRHRNLRLLMHKLGGQKALIEATGKSQGQISQLVKLADYKKMGEKLARDIEQKCDLPTGWLDTDTTAQKINEAPTPTYTATPHQPGDNYQTISTALRRVPVISPAMAGRWRDIVENFDPGTASDWTETTLDLGAHGFALRMVGDSMYSQHHDKSIPDGATMYVKADLEPETGDIVVARPPNAPEATVKQLVIDGGQRYLKPLNPEYKTLDVTDGCEIIGVVVEWSKRIK